MKSRDKEACLNFDSLVSVDSYMTCIVYHPYIIHSLPVYLLLYRQAVANALAAAPSMWTLGNAGMGALQVCLKLNNCNRHSLL